VSIKQALSVSGDTATVTELIDQNLLQNGQQNGLQNGQLP
jgi:hypothetical protein